MFRFRRFSAPLVVLAAALALSGCVIGPEPPSTEMKLSVEQRKIEVAQLRDRGLITFEEAARRQFSIQRNAYTLTDGELAFWRTSIEYAMQVDRGQITRAEYQRLVQIAHDRYVVKPAAV